MFRIKVTSNKGHNEWLDKLKHKSWEDAAAFLRAFIQVNFCGWPLEIREDEMVWKITSPYAGTRKDDWISFEIIEESPAEGFTEVGLWG